MRTIKIAGIAIAAYVGVIVAFESLVGYFQPADETTLVITTVDADGVSHDRVLSRLESNDQLYVASNHWIRGWYHDALERSEAQVSLDGEKGDYRVVPVSGVEHDRIAGEHALGIGLRILTGFPPRYFLRLDPVTEQD